MGQNRVMTGMRRWMMRAPLGLYRVGLGRVLGRRFLRLEHRGRRSGSLREAVLEVAGEIDGAPVVVSGYGTSSDWYQNVVADPRVGVTWGTRSFPAEARRLEPSETADLLRRYRDDHPRAAVVLADRLGVSLVDDPARAAAALPAFLLEPIVPTGPGSSDDPGV